MDNQTVATDPARPSQHCRKFGWSAGDCKMLHCSRCGEKQYKRLADRIIRAAMKQTELLFITIYYDRIRVSLDELPLFAIGESGEQKFRLLLTKVLAALRKKARRAGKKMEYVAVIAFGRANHRIHKKVHCHVLATYLPDLIPIPTKAHPERIECRFLTEKLKDMQLIAWVEKPRSKQAVARYTAANLKTVIGKPEMKNVRAFRFSQGYET